MCVNHTRREPLQNLSSAYPILCSVNYLSIDRPRARETSKTNNDMLVCNRLPLIFPPKILAMVLEICWGKKEFKSFFDARETCKLHSHECHMGIMISLLFAVKCPGVNAGSNPDIILIDVVEVYHISRWLQ